MPGGCTVGDRRPIPRPAHSWRTLSTEVITAVTLPGRPRTLLVRGRTPCWQLWQLL